MNNRHKGARARLIVLMCAIIASVVLHPISTFAAAGNIELMINAERSDVYNKLLSAAKIQAVANVLKRCIPEVDPGVGRVFTVDDIKKGKLFNTVNTNAIALWLEQKVGDKDRNGMITCGGHGDGVWKAFMEVTGLSFGDIACNGGEPGLFQRISYDYNKRVHVRENSNCDSFDDNAAVYVYNINPRFQFAKFYNQWANSQDNEYVPRMVTYDTYRSYVSEELRQYTAEWYADEFYNEKRTNPLGNFNNSAGYFNYLWDFNLNCSADKATLAEKKDNTDYTKITIYEKEANSIIAQDYYYHVHDPTKNWTSSILGKNSEPRTCGGLLTRASELLVKYNGIPIPSGKELGFEGVILDELNSACKNIVTAEGKSGWEEFKEKLQEIIDNRGSSKELVRDAEKRLEIVNEVLNGGDSIDLIDKKDEGNGRTVYQCVSVEGLNIRVEDYNLGTGTNSAERDPCMSNAGSLGWWVCPVMNWFSGTLDTVYEKAVEPFLQIDPDMITHGATRDVWTAVIGIANTMIIFFFLVIIFSQLTGVGIDNYNIKKMLPKIIVVAVLVNLSYLICQLAVDVSNIVGNGLDDMLRNLAPTPSSIYPKWGEESMLSDGSSLSNDNGWFQTLVDITSLGLVGGGAASIVLSVSNAGGILAGLILPILLMLITALFAVMFFFILMGIRQAGVVILVVLAPLAMVCYMLPNTKKYFDKWKKAFSSLLLLYPICGLIVGGGEFTSRLLISVSQDYLVFFVACVLMVVPFFFIPTLLKGSLQAMGNIGAKVSGLGKTLGSRSRGAVDKGVRNNKAFQDRVKFNQEQSALKRANRIKNGIRLPGGRVVGGLGNRDEKTLSKRQKMRLMNANDTILADRDKEKRAESSAKDINFMAREMAQDKKFEGEELSNYMTYINDKTRNGEDEEALFALYDQYTNGPNKNKAAAVAVARIAGRRKDTAAAFMSKKFNDISKYSPEIAQSVAKEIATGENSRMYMGSTPLQFEYAAQLNRAKYDSNTNTFDTGRTDAHGKPITISPQYNGWANNTDNVHAALDKYVTDSRQLAGMKGSALKELQNLMNSGVVSDADKARINTLATQMIENQDKMPLDYTKGAEYAALTGGAYKFDAETQKFVRLQSPTTTAPTTATAPGATSDAGDFAISHDTGR